MIDIVSDLAFNIYVHKYSLSKSNQLNRFKKLLLFKNVSLYECRATGLLKQFTLALAKCMYVYVQNLAKIKRYTKTGQGFLRNT